MTDDQPPDMNDLIRRRGRLRPLPSSLSRRLREAWGVDDEDDTTDRGPDLPAAQPLQPLKGIIMRGPTNIPSSAPLFAGHDAGVHELPADLLDVRRAVDHLGSLELPESPYDKAEADLRAAVRFAAQAGAAIPRVDELVTADGAP